MARKFVYFFGKGKAEGRAVMKDLLGGKGSNLAEMTALGVPVPPGFTITTEACVEFMRRKGKYPPGLWEQVKRTLASLEEAMGATFGDPRNPLLISVRSGARVSMPGMMDTVLNLGLNDRTVQGLIARSGNPRFAYDSYRRFVQMFGDVVLGLKPESQEERDPFEVALEQKKREEGVTEDTDLRADALRDLVGRFKTLIRQRKGVPFPEDPEEQLRLAVSAVFESWNTPRAVKYRELHRIPAGWGTGVNVQAMVFGNLGDTSASGVAFTRDPSSGAKRLYGEFLLNAQGEDVVAGIRTPQPIERLRQLLPKAYAQFTRIAGRLEKHYRDMQDIEFTIQDGRLYVLQTRTGKRTGVAAVKIAVDMVREGLIDRRVGLLRVDPRQLEQLLHPMIDPKAKLNRVGKGLPASPGAAVGRVVFTADAAEAWAARGERVILVRVETSPEDIGGIHAAQGILTARGGMTCVAGETRLLTDRGMVTAEAVFDLLEKGATLRILSFDCRALRPVWREIVAAGRRPAEAITVAVSQTGRAEQNVLRLTAEHKMFTVQNRRLTKKPLDAVLADEDFLTVVDWIPPLGETAVSPALAFVAGALLSDGYIRLRPTKGSVTFVQKPTPEKADFIAAVVQAFERAFGVPFSYVRQRETVAWLRDREIRGRVEDRICFHREPAARLAEIRENLSAWVLTLDRTALLHFLAGYVDGDGTYAEESSAIRLQIVVSQKRPEVLEGLALACLRLGIVPQITNNRDAYLVQIAEQVEDILAFAHRVKAALPVRRYESKCLAVRALFEDIVDRVNFMGRVREAVKRNIMFGVEKIRRDILPLCPDVAFQEVQALLDAPLRSYRATRSRDPERIPVYNFEVDAADDMEKNFLVFSSGMTPVLVSNSHAAVVARGMGKPCVAGCGDITVHEAQRAFEAKGQTVREGDWVTLDGTIGDLILGKVPLIQPELSGDFATLMRWADAVRTIGVRTNADTPVDARATMKFGAEGIGLCRTEHMFFEGNRIDAVREMILAEDEAGRRKALAKLLPMQRGDFLAIFEEMKGLPVIIRLLDPPLHEFLPKTEEEIVATARAMGLPVESVRNRAESLREINPMLGHRGCRLGIAFPEITEMQARAIFEAACQLAKQRKKVLPEIMIPLVGIGQEFRHQRAIVDRVAGEVMGEAGVRVRYLVGTMIEIPRACLVADEIARDAEFFSFGTNDLTQTTFGFSRDDAGKFLAQYLEQGILGEDPFITVDERGVGELMQLGIQRGRKVRKDLEVGICGEHGGDPASVEFCHRVGLDYVSCSPYRVPVAKLAAAQAALRGRVRVTEMGEK